MKQKKYWTLQRIILIVLALILIVDRLMKEDDISKGLAISAIIVGIIGTIIYFAVRKKGIFVKK